MKRIEAEFGMPEVLIRNAVAFLHLARHVAPAMIEAGCGVSVVARNTSALRGKSNFSGFAPTKAAQRILANSMTRELGPKASATPIGMLNRREQEKHWTPHGALPMLRAIPTEGVQPP